MTKTLAAVCLLALAGCDSTYTPSVHHEAEASTGSRLSGIDTGVSTNGASDPSITNNAGGPGGAGGGH